MTKMRAKLAKKSHINPDEDAKEKVPYLEEAPGFLPIRHPAYTYDFDSLYRIINVLVKEGVTLDWRRFFETFYSLFVVVYQFCVCCLSPIFFLCSFLGHVAKYLEGNLEVYDYYSSKKCDNEFISLCRGLVIDPSLKVVCSLFLFVC
jgi:hypothetical protein